MRFDPPSLQQLRRDLMERGRTLATLLAQILAGKRPPSLAAILAERPGLRPEEAMRLALDQVESRRRLLDSADDRFGRCDVCGTDLGIAALGEMPWADRCRAHTTV